MDKTDASYLDSSDVEAVARMVNALLTEHWIMRDRLAILEHLLDEGGIVKSRDIEAYVPAGEFAEALETLRGTVFGNVIGAPFAPQAASVAELRNKRP